MSDQIAASHDTFVETKEYRRFAEFCDACRQHRYIGICYGPPGVGKTSSAWQYAQWHRFETYFAPRFYNNYRLSFIAGTIAEQVAAITPRPQGASLPERASVLYTPAVTHTPQRLAQELRALRLALTALVHAAEQPPNSGLMIYRRMPDVTELLIIDETDRLKMAALEQVRDIHDQDHLGVVLMGMPGLEKRLSRYPQLYSRVGFVHEFHPLTTEEVHAFLLQHWQALGLTSHPETVSEQDAIAAIIRITNGNLRLLQRLLAQIERITEINALKSITKEVVEVARQQLVIGSV